MQPRNLPVIDGRYWIALMLASIAGANFGDLLSHLGLGHWRGLPILLVLFGLVLAVERTARFRTEAFYWLAILLVRTAATNLGDLATHDLHASYPVFVAILAVVLAVLAVPAGGAKADGVPRTGAFYWLAMLTAGTLGTALGDYCADLFGLGNSLVAWAVVWAVAVALVLRSGLAAIAAVYWATVVVVRTAGTNAGDYLAGRHGLALGLPVSTALSTLALVLVVALWRRRRVPALVSTAA